MDDYDRENKTVSISKALGSRVIIQNKDTDKYATQNKESYRTVPLPEIAYKQLEKCLYLRKEYHLRFANIFTGSEFIFVKRDNTTLSPRDLRKKFNVRVKKLDVTPISPHGLRHTYTSVLIQSDTNVKQIQLLLGHGSIKTTLDIYAHISEDKQKETIAKFDDMLKKMS